MRGVILKVIVFGCLLGTASGQDPAEEVAVDSAVRIDASTPPTSSPETVIYWECPEDATATHDAHTLDLYRPSDGEDLPILLFLHGGAWKVGDKNLVHGKPQAFNTRGFIFASANYRLFPEGDFRKQAADVAHAIRWLHDHASEIGGSSRKIFLMGHSAGAHLAGLATIDPRYLAEVGLTARDVQGVILLDGAGYDIPRQIEGAVFRRARGMYHAVFTEDPKTQREASPAFHVTGGLGLPPFLLFHLGKRADSRAQSEGLATRLRAAGGDASVVAVQGKSHVSINREFGLEGDDVTRQSFEFLQARLAEVRP